MLLYFCRVEGIRSRSFTFKSRSFTLGRCLKMGWKTTASGHDHFASACHPGRHYGLAASNLVSQIQIFIILFVLFFLLILSSSFQLLLSQQFRPTFYELYLYKQEMFSARLSFTSILPDGNDITKTV